MDRRKKMVKHAPAMIEINQSVFRMSSHKHFLSFGVWVFGGMTLALIASHAPAHLTLVFLFAALLLGYVYWRWTFCEHRITDAMVTDRVLTDPIDFAWLEWARDLEPEIDALLIARRPNGRYTLKDFQAAYARHARYLRDIPDRRPYYGDTEAAFEDLEKRREPQRQKRAEEKAP